MRTLTVPALVESLTQVNALIHRLATEAELSPGSAYRLRLATEELFVNVVRHGYGTPRGQAEVRLEADVAADGAVWVRIIDSARPFDPFAPAAPGPPAADGRPGGLGLYLVRDAVDGASHEYARGTNRTTIVVRRESATGDRTGPCPKAH